MPEGNPLMVEQDIDDSDLDFEEVDDGALDLRNMILDEEMPPEEGVQLTRAQKQAGQKLDLTDVREKVRQANNEMIDELQATTKDLCRQVEYWKGRSALHLNQKRDLFQELKKTQNSVGTTATSGVTRKAVNKQRKLNFTVSDHLGGVSAAHFVMDCWNRVRAMKDNVGGPVSFSFEFQRKAASIREEYFIPKVTIVAPHKSRQKYSGHGCWRTGCGAENPCTGWTCIGLTRPKVFYTESGPELIAFARYQCYHGDQNKSGHTEWNAANRDFAVELGFEAESLGYRYTGNAVYSAALVEQIMHQYTLTRENGAGACETITKVYAHKWTERVLHFMEDKNPAKMRMAELKLHPEYAQQTLHSFACMRLNHTDGNVDEDGSSTQYSRNLQFLKEPAGPWGFVDATTVNRLITEVADERKKHQDALMKLHMKSSKILSGDHVYSMHKNMQKKTRKDCMYTLMNERQFVIASVWADSESYSLLRELFQSVKKETKQPDGSSSVTCIYVDKCCGLGGFKNSILDMFGDDKLLVKLDLFHGVRRLKKVLNMRNPEHVKMMRAIRDAHWVDLDGNRVTDHAKIPHDRKRVPNREILMANISDVVENQFSDLLDSSESIRNWWNRYRQHIESDCLSDPRGYDLVFLDADGKPTTGRGSVKNESYHRHGNDATNTGACIGRQNLAAIHRATAMDWNLKRGHKAFEWWIPPMQDFDVIRALMHGSDQYFSNDPKILEHKRPFYHPRLKELMNATRLADCCFFDDYHPAPICKELEDVNPELAHIAQSVVKGPIQELVGHTDIQLVRKGLSTVNPVAFLESSIFKQVQPKKRGKYAAVSGKDVATVLAQCLMKTEQVQANDVAKVKETIVDIVRQNPTQFKDYVQVHHDVNSDTGTALGFEFDGCTPPDHLWEVLTAFATYIQLPLTLIYCTDKDSGPRKSEIVTPHPDLIAINALQAQYVPVFLISYDDAKYTIRAILGNDLTVADIVGLESDSDDEESDAEIGGEPTDAIDVDADEPVSRMPQPQRVAKSAAVAAPAVKKDGIVKLKSPPKFWPSNYTKKWSHQHHWLLRKCQKVKKDDGTIDWNGIVLLWKTQRLEIIRQGKGDEKADPNEDDENKWPLANWNDEHLEKDYWPPQFKKMLPGHHQTATATHGLTIAMQDKFREELKAGSVVAEPSVGEKRDRVDREATDDPAEASDARPDENARPAAREDITKTLPLTAQFSSVTPVKQTISSTSRKGCGSKSPRSRKSSSASKSPRAACIQRAATVAKKLMSPKSRTPKTKAGTVRKQKGTSTVK